MQNEIIRQLEFTIEDLETSDGEFSAEEKSPDTALETPAKARRAYSRKPLPKHLPRDVVEYRKQHACSECGDELSKLVEDVSEGLTRISRPTVSIGALDIGSRIPENQVCLR